MNYRLELAYEREVAALEAEYDAGQMTRDEFNDAMRELDRDYRALELGGGGREEGA